MLSIFWIYLAGLNRTILLLLFYFEKKEKSLIGDIVKEIELVVTKFFKRFLFFRLQTSHPLAALL